VAKRVELRENTAAIHDAQTGKWLFFERPAVCFDVRDPGDVVPALKEIERRIRQKGLMAAGFVAYEAAPAFDAALKTKPAEGFPLLWFGLYRECREIALPDAARAVCMDWRSSTGEEAYRRAVARIKEYIQAGDTYQTNYTLRLHAPFREDPLDFFARIIGAQRCAYGALVNTGDWTVCCASPELFFSLDGRELVSRPMKGTIARGLWHEQDRANAARLRESEKDRAENVMIVDMVRNDMGRIAATGSVEVVSLFDIEQYPTLWQMTSTVRCATDAGIAEIFGALFPPASITGAPKARTMEIIAELEDQPRRIYCGTVGMITAPRKAQFNVAIRTVLIDNRTGAAEYGAGGGIVWDSTAESEFGECATKARVLSHAPPDFALLETMRWTPEDGFFLLDRHLRRLRQSAEYFGFAMDEETVRRSLSLSVATLPARPHRIRLVVSRDGKPSIEAFPLVQPLHYRICIAKKPVDRQNPLLYHKTTCRDIYDRARRDCPGFDDVLLWNDRGEITESCIANVVVEMEGERVTPPVECGLLPGTYRAMLLEQGLVKEQRIGLADLARCSGVFLINSVREAWRVSIEGAPDISGCFRPSQS